MEKTTEFLQSYGSDILSSPHSINNGTKPIIDASDGYLNACKEAISGDCAKEIIAGICFSFGPYISNNFDSKDEKDCWEILINLSHFIIENPIIYGYLEAVTELSIRSRKVSEEFLLFLQNPEMETPNEHLKPLLLTSLFEYLPDGFIFENTDYFYSLVQNSFQVDDFLFRSNFLLLLSKMNLNIEMFISNPSFVSLIWDFIYESSQSDINFPVLSNPLEKLRDLVPVFFELPNEVITQKLQSVDSENIFGLVRLLPYLNFDYFQNVFKILFDFVSENLHILPKLNDAVFDSLDANFNEQYVEYMFSILSKNLLKDFDDVSIYLFSLYFPLFEDPEKDSGLFLIKSINLAFSSLTSNKSILCFAIYQIAEQYKTRSRILSNSVIPSLISIFTLNNDECSKYSSKAFIKLYQTHTLQPSVYLNNYLALFDTLKTIPSYSLYSMKKYFKVLCTIVALKDEDDDNSEQKIFDETLILEFVQKNIFDSELILEFKAFFLELSTALLKSFPNKFEPLNDSASLLAKTLLESNVYFSYPIAAEFILFSENFPELDIIYNRLIDISTGKFTEEKVEDEIIRTTSYYTAIISSENQEFQYPIEIINEQLHSEDYFYQSRAILNLQFIFPKYNDEILTELLSYIIQLSKVSQSSVVVDSTFILLKKLIKMKTEFAFQFALDLILSTMQGRIALLDHNFPVNYDHRKFKFYKCLSSFIKYYKDKSANFVLELIDWAPIASEEILPKIITCINRALEFTVEASIIPQSKIPILWETLLERLKENWRNTDLANYLLGCLVNLLIEYPDICNSKDLMDQMEYMYSESQEENDDEMILILPPIFLDIWSNTNAPIVRSLFHEFSDYIIAEQCNDWDYPLTLNYYVKIVNNDNREPDPYIITDASCVLAHFILADNEKKQELQFNEEMIAIMKKSLAQCCVLCKRVKEIIFEKYCGYPKKIETLIEIFDSEHVDDLDI